ncbi:hypothetical protein TNCV_481971 [Trichonephila clavipes]|nr:hypothetical protein TNCV_481971 [Trichonephila clavipes]
MFVIPTISKLFFGEIGMLKWVIPSFTFYLFEMITGAAGTSSRLDEIILASLRSGHTPAQQHVAGLKVCLLCLNFATDPIRSCPHLDLAGCHKSQLLSSPATASSLFKSALLINHLDVSVNQVG